MPTESHPFLAALAASVAVVLATAWLGRRGRRRAHLAGGMASALVLGYTILLAERLGRALVMPPRVLAVHLVFANLAALAFLVVVASGSRLWLREALARRRLHRRAVVAFLTLTVLATATGTYMLSRSTPRPAAGATGEAP